MTYHLDSLQLDAEKDWVGKQSNSLHTIVDYDNSAGSGNCRGGDERDRVPPSDWIDPNQDWEEDILLSRSRSIDAYINDSRIDVGNSGDNDDSILKSDQQQGGRAVQSSLALTSKSLKISHKGHQAEPESRQQMERNAIPESPNQEARDDSLESTRGGNGLGSRLSSVALLKTNAKSQLSSQTGPVTCLEHNQSYSKETLRSPLFDPKTIVEASQRVVKAAVMNADRAKSPSKNKATSLDLLQGSGRSQLQNEKSKFSRQRMEAAPVEQAVDVHEVWTNAGTSPDDGLDSYDWGEIIDTARIISRHYEVELLEKCSSDRRVERKEYRRAMALFRRHAKELNMLEKDLFAVVQEDESVVNEDLTFEESTTDGEDSWTGMGAFDNGLDRYVEAFEGMCAKMRCG